MWAHGSGGDRWKADGPHARGPWTRGINPHKIATAINEDLLKETNEAAQAGQIPWTEDNYKLNAYDFIQNMRTAIDKGMTLAARRLDGNYK